MILPKRKKIENKYSTQTLLRRNEVLVSRSIPPPVTLGSIAHLMVPIDWETMGLVICTLFFLSFMIALYDSRQFNPLNLISYATECIRTTGLLFQQAKDQKFTDRTLSSNVLVAAWVLGCIVLIGYYNSFTVFH